MTIGPIVTVECLLARQQRRAEQFWFVSSLRTALNGKLLIVDYWDSHKGNLCGVFPWPWKVTVDTVPE
jgi:hypothetical protein